MRSAHRVARTLRNPAILGVLSWLIWLVAVAVFAFWTQAYYRAPAKPAWIGMTIRTSTFAFWALVIREWLALRLQRRRRQPRSEDEIATTLDDYGATADDTARQQHDAPYNKNEQ